MSAAEATASARGLRLTPLVAAWGLLPLAAAAYQVAAKFAARDLRPGDLLGSMLRSPAAWATAACDFACFVAWMAVLSSASLSAAFPLTSLSYVLVLVASATLFHEAVHPLQLVGVAAILAGAWLIAAPAARTPR